MTIVGATTASRDALNHLRAVKTNDGWSVEVRKRAAASDDDAEEEELRLLRRNAPLTDHYFADIHHDPKADTIVGVLDEDGAVCQILVDGTSGRPVPQKNVEYVDCAATYPGRKPLSKVERAAATSSRNAYRGGSSSSSRVSGSARGNTAAPNNNRNDNNAPVNNPFSDLSEEDKQKYMKCATYAIGGYVALSVLSNAIGEGFLYFLILPGLYVYGLQTCPSNESFDAKKEVKRVLRGHHLPDDHPQKPKRGNFLEEWTARITASVATEVGAAAGGYTTEIAPLVGGVAKHASVTLPTLGLTCEWIGCNDTWYHYRTLQQPPR
mmetsp:Transcript_11360/g.27225  ORF Transcript_11360/g.27225 Transcript_11360/m.27225 type:complete len:323 (+) Transcript_11360:271-1239(+)